MINILPRAIGTQIPALLISWLIAISPALCTEALPAEEISGKLEYLLSHDGNVAALNDFIKEIPTNVSARGLEDIIERSKFLAEYKINIGINTSGSVKVDIFVLANPGYVLTMCFGRPSRSFTLACSSARAKKTEYDFNTVPMGDDR